MKDIIDAIFKYKKKTGRNIIICGPRMGKEDYNERSQLLRVYSYGGLVAEFGLTKTGKMSVSLLSGGYYEGDKYITGEEQKYLSELPKGNKSLEKKQVLLNEQYWHCASKAAENRYSKIFGDKIEPKERNIESHILEMYINNNNEKENFCIFDMEFYQPSSWKQLGIEGKPDLICFDGEAFGLIELKYNNQACDNGKNKVGLNKHFDDLQKTCCDPRPNLVQELKRRVKLCNQQECELINKALANKISEMPLDKKLWFGFLFVNNNGTDPRDKIANSKIDDEARIMCVKDITEIAAWKWVKRSELGI